MKKVLFIYYHFPPIMGDWRGLGFVKLLPQFGWQPIVISAAESVTYEKDYSLVQRVPDNIEIHRIGHGESSKEWQYARSKLKLNYVFPDYYKSWYSPALREARKVLQKGRIDLVFSSSPPYTTAFVAINLKEEFNIPWVVEWRDLWSGNDFLNLHYDKTLIKPLRQIQKYRIRKAESNILQAADKTIVVCEHHKQQLCRQHGIQAEKIDIITNAYDELDFEELIPRAPYLDKLTIVFLGSVYPDFMEPIQNFLNAVNEVDKEAEVAFIGRGAAALQGITMENLTCVLHLVKEKALAFALGSDFLFIVMPPSARWIPGKLFEYLRLGKPILGLVPEGGDPAKIIKEAKAGFILSYDPEEMKRQLKAIFNQWKQGKLKNFEPDREYIAQFERHNLTRKLVAVFDKVIA